MCFRIVLRCWLMEQHSDPSDCEAATFGVTRLCYSTCKKYAYELCNDFVLLLFLPSSEIASVKSQIGFQGCLRIYSLQCAQCEPFMK